MNEDIWNTNLWEDTIIPLAQKAIDKHGDDMLSGGANTTIKDIIDQYNIELINNDVIKYSLFKQMFPRFADTQCQVNVNIEYKDKLRRNVYCVIFQYVDGQWVHDNT